MKLIIDISEEYYRACKSWDKNNIAMVEQSIIAHGTPYEEERPHGEWIETGEMEEYWGEEYECSVCGLLSHEHNFCPNCGADMRKEGGEK